MRKEIDDYDDDDLDEAAVVSPPQSARRRIFKWLFQLFLFALLLFCCFGIFLDYYGHIDQARPVDAIVILGASVAANNLPGDSLRARTEKAVALYQKKIANKIICTGGLGENPPTEAYAAATLAQQLGVNSADLLLEMKSTNTRENARNAAQICREYGWSRVVIVSDPYHLWRAKKDFRLAGITAYPSPALTCERERKLSLRIIWIAREEVAILRDIIVQQITKQR